MEQVDSVDTRIDRLLSNFLKKPILIKAAVYLILMLYAAHVAPRPPKVVVDLFENQYFKLFFFALILWTAQFSPSTSLMVAIAFMVSMNYMNQRALWEFMENVEATSAPTAPSKEVALETSAAIVETQNQQPQVVQSMTQGGETIVVQPTIIQTPEGTTVQNPTVVIAPAVVANENGEKVLIKPDVTVVEVPSAPAPEPQAAQTEQVQAPAVAPEVVAPQQEAAVSAVTALAAAASSAEPTSPQQVAELAQAATSAVTTTEGKEAVEKLAQQAVKPEAGKPEEVKVTAEAAIQEIITPAAPQEALKEAACYPIRRYDMSKVMPFSSADFYGSL